MSGTADVEKDVWADPWFLALSPEAKALYLWAITNDHAHIGGLYMVARPMIEFETGLKGRRFDKALEELTGKLLYDEPTGAVWVRGRAKRIRMKTEQVAKSVAAAVKKCPHPPFALGFIEKYADAPWITKHPAVAEGLGEVRVNLSEVQVNLNANGSTEPNPVNLTRTSPEVPSQRLGQVVKEEQQRSVAPAPPKLAAGLTGYLVPVADALRRVADGKPGAIAPTDAAVAKSLQDFPSKDFLPLVADFEHYWLHGRGAGAVRKDIVATWRNWLAKQTDVLRKTPPAGQGTSAGPQRESIDEERERKLREQLQ